MRDRRRHRRRRRACRFLPLSNPSLLVALVFLVVVVQIVVQVHVQIHRVLHLETRDVFLPKQQQQRRPTRTIFLQTREKIPRRSQSASSSSSSPSLLQWSNGCQEWINDKTTQRDRNPLEETSSLPTGIVVTLVMIPDEKHYQKGMRTLLCNALASQMMHLLGPQQWDLLLLLTTNTTAAVATTITPFRTIQQCLNLSTHTDEESDEDAKGPPHQRVWNNLDGSNLTATLYHYHVGHDDDNGKKIATRVYLATYRPQWPWYMQQQNTTTTNNNNGSSNQKLVVTEVDPPECNAPRSYIQSTRWYTNEMLHLSILQEYDYFIKLDLDIFMERTIPIDMLHDMKQRRAVVGHTAAFPEGLGTDCAKGIVKAVQEYLDRHNHSIHHDATREIHKESWQGRYCTEKHDTWELATDTDLYYTNFFIGLVEFWTQPAVLDLARYLSEYREGFFRHRWTDQIFWHQAMGLFLKSKKQQHVADYTAFRCSVEPNCWRAVFFEDLYTDSYHRCDNGGYFRHEKNPFAHWVPPTPAAWTRSRLWRKRTHHEEEMWNNLTYRDDCAVTLLRRKFLLQSGSIRRNDSTPKRKSN